MIWELFLEVNTPIYSDILKESLKQHVLVVKSMSGSGVNKIQYQSHFQNLTFNLTTLILEHCVMHETLQKT